MVLIQILTQEISVVCRDLDYRRSDSLHDRRHDYHSDAGRFCADHLSVDDFISPTILERLRQQNKDNPLFQPQVRDWRSIVDSVMTDSNYDGKVFNITLADVPERKNDLVEGKYVIETKKGATVAVKVRICWVKKCWW